MNIPRIADALGQIGEKHISEAMDYRRIRNTGSRLKYGALAAGVLLVFAAAAISIREIDISVTPEPDITIISIETDPTITITSDEIDSSVNAYETTKGTETEISDVTPAIGGSDYTFSRKYVNEVYNIYLASQIVGNEVRDEWVNNVFLMRTPDEQEDPPPLYQMIHDLNISKEDFIAKNAENIAHYYSEEVISALYLEDISEMKRQLVNPLALYYDGEIYTFDELSQNPQSGKNIPDDVLKEYLDYIESVCEHENLLKYMQEDIDRIRMTCLTYGTAEGTETEISDDSPCIGGSDTTFMRRYVEKVENLYIIDQIVEPEVRDDWVENVYLAQSPKEQDDLPAVYQAIHDLNIPKEDFIAENEKLSDYSGMYFSEEVIDALYLEDISEMKRRLVNPYALYYDGEIYTFDGLLQDPQSGADIPDDVLNEYLDFIESVCEQENLLKYMQNDIDSLRR